MTREEAWNLVTEFVSNQALRKHMLAVEAAMCHYAGIYSQDAQQWAIVGLLHDFDYEKYPEAPAHTREGARILRERGVDEDVVGAILSHADWNLHEYPRNTPLRKALFAVDELCGFIVAVALVRPEKLEGMKPSSVKKKMKQKSFAAAVSREDILKGAELLELPLDEHISNCIAALYGARHTLGLS